MTGVWVLLGHLRHPGFPGEITSAGKLLKANPWHKSLWPRP